jgi:ribose 5-phosphate isomerase A
MDTALSALAAKALDFVPDGSRIGLGTGRAATAFLHALAGRVRQGLRVRGVPTSEAIGSLARSLGVAVDTLDADEPLEVTIDGADEVERGTLNLIKGLGGALARERVVAAASRRQVILVTPEKLVGRLGERGVLPVEVLPFAESFCRRRILAQGPRPQSRLHGGAPFVTDNGNRVLDCAVGPIADPAALEAALCAIPGVVDTGLFLGTASLVLVGRADGVEEMRRGQGS